MRPMPVVVMEPGGELKRALPGVMVSTSVSPLAQGSLNEALRLAIGARSEGFGEEVTDVVCLAEAAEGTGFIAGAVVGEEAANAKAKTSKESEGSLQESGCGRAFLVGVDGGKSHAGMIINGDMDILPTPSPWTVVGDHHLCGDRCGRNGPVSCCRGGAGLLAGHIHSAGSVERAAA